MVLCPLVLCFRRARCLLPEVDIPLISIAALILLLPLLYHPEHVRWSTMLYSCGFSLFFMMAVRAFRVATPSPSQVARLLAWIIYAFAIVLLSQQIAFQLKLPLPFTGPNSMVFGYYQSPLKQISLTSEPSESTMHVAFLFYFLMRFRRLDNPDYSLRQSLISDRYVWLAMLWVFFSAYNASAFMFAPMLFLPWLTRRNYYKVLPVAGAIFALAVVAAPHIDYEPVQRFGKFVRVVPSFDTDTIMESDGSSCYRIVQHIEGAKHASLSTLDDWVGHGIDTDLIYLDEKLCYNYIVFPGSFHVWYVYGFPVALMLWVFIISVTFRPRDPSSWFIALFALYLSGANNYQPLWMLLFLAYVLRELSSSYAIEYADIPSAQRLQREHPGA